MPANQAACFGCVFPKVRTAYSCSGAIAAVAQAWPLLLKRSMPHSPVYVPLILRGYIDDALIRMIEGQHRQQIVLDMPGDQEVSLDMQIAVFPPCAGSFFCLATIAKSGAPRPPA